MPHDDVFAALDGRVVDGQDLVDDVEHEIEGRLNCVAAVDRDVAMENLLQHLRVSNEPRSFAA